MRGLIRQFFPMLTQLLESWTSYKHDLRLQALRGCNLSFVHMQDLLYSSPFCELLFPTEAIDVLREAAKARMVSLEWYMGLRTSTRQNQAGARKRKSSKQRRALKKKKLATSQAQPSQDSGSAGQQQQGQQHQGQGGNFCRPRKPKHQGSKGQSTSGPSQSSPKGKGSGQLTKGGGQPRQ